MKKPLFSIGSYPTGGMTGGFSNLGTFLYVHDTQGKDGNDGSISAPLASVAKALTQLAKRTVNMGDTIVLLHGHSETISSATALDISREGVNIIGLGEGTSQPKFTLDTATTATITISAANVLIENVHFEANFADIAACLTLTTAKNLRLIDCRWSQAGADLNFVDFIKTSTTDNDADGLTILGCKAIGIDTANDNFVNTRGDIDSLRMENNYISLGVAASEAIIEAQTGKDFTNCVIKRNQLLRLNTAGAMAMSSDTANNSGIIELNVVKHADTAGAACWDVTGAGLFDNKAVGVDDASGLLIPAVDDNA